MEQYMDSSSDLQSLCIVYSLIQGYVRRSKFDAGTLAVLGVQKGVHISRRAESLRITWLQGCN